MPGMSGFQVFDALKADPRLAEVPVIFVTSHRDAAFEVAGFEMGAADFIGKPVNPPLVIARVKMQLRAKRMADELRRIATIDVLTGVANRRRFDESLDREWRRARRSGEPIALLMVDVDHFKPFNDRYGHPAGDTCLRTVAQTLVRTTLRPADMVARYGGEEFVMLLPQTARGGAQQMASRVLHAVETLAITHETSRTSRHLTVSIGVGCYDHESHGWMPPSAESRCADLHVACSPMNLLHAADKALYSAKHGGRAQARMLDIAEVDTPQLAREIASSFGTDPSADESQRMTA
jgi:diguanylate cyclase (GGDEF)-like protein